MSLPDIDTFGSQSWYNSKRQFHREDGLAFVSSVASQWLINNRTRRIDGPAICWESGDKEWWVNGKRCYDNKSYQEAAGLSDEDMMALRLKYGNVE